MSIETTSRKNYYETITSRKLSKNEIIILSELEALKSDITTTALSTQTGINPKNIGRYLKTLEESELINRETEQNGRERIIWISLTSREEIKENITSRKNKLDAKSEEISDILEENPIKQAFDNKSEKEEITSRKSDIEKITDLPGRVVKNNVVPGTNEDFNIDFELERIAKSSEFMRLMISTMEGTTTNARGSKKKIKKRLKYNIMKFRKGLNQ